MHICLTNLINSLCILSARLPATRPVELCVFRFLTLTILGNTFRRRSSASRFISTLAKNFLLLDFREDCYRRLFTLKGLYLTDISGWSTLCSSQLSIPQLLSIYAVCSFFDTPSSSDMRIPVLLSTYIFVSSSSSFFFLYFFIFPFFIVALYRKVSVY